MTEQLLAVLKIGLLILLYLFFLRVVRAVWAEVRDPALADTGGGSRTGGSMPAPNAPPKPAPKPKRRSSLSELVVVAPPALAGAAHRLARESTIGRAPGCTIVIDDQFISSVHTRVFQRDGAWFVEDLGSTNGTYLNRQKVTEPTAIHKRDRVRIGNVELEAR